MSLITVCMCVCGLPGQIDQSISQVGQVGQVGQADCGQWNGPVAEKEDEERKGKIILNIEVITVQIKSIVQKQCLNELQLESKLVWY